jgi:hypothetical protein
MFRRRNLNLLIPLVLACVNLFAILGGSLAATLTVTNTNNTGTGSLRQAVLDSNTLAGSDTIVFDPVVFGTPQTITLASVITINPATGDSLTIIGPGEDLLTVSGNNAVRIFTLSSGDTASISGMTLTLGDDSAIGNSGTLTVTNVTFHDNTAGNGGAIVNGGASLTIIGCTFTENECTSGSATGLGGGAIYSSTSGTVSVSNSTFTGNNEIGGSGGGGAIRNRSGTMNISDSTFTGNTAVDGAGGVVNSDIMTMTGCTVTGNSTNANGGGVSNSGQLTMTNCVVTGNLANTHGGGIRSATPSAGDFLSISNSTISSNTANAENNTAGDGGGLSISGIGVTISNSTISGNMALGSGTNAGNGGGIDSDSAVATLTNVTISGNSAGRDGGGVKAIGTSTFSTTLNSCTIVNNTAVHDGGGILRGSSTVPVNLHATIVANNSDDGTAPDILGSVVSQGYNLIENLTGAMITGDTTGNIIGQDPVLGALAAYGGATQTHALLAGSPAIDAADPVNFPATDQRGIERAQDGDNTGSARADIGAYEGAALGLASAVSRKTHGPAGEFDLPLVLHPPGSGTVEPRASGPTTLVLYFTENVTAADGVVNGNEFAIMNATYSSASISGNTVTLNLTNVVNQSVVSVSINGITSISGTTLMGDSDIEVRALVGDTNGSTSVNATDISQAKSKVGNIVSGSNFWHDVTVDGNLNTSDVLLVKFKSGTNVP